MSPSPRAIALVLSSKTLNSAFGSLVWLRTTGENAAFLEEDQLLRDASRLDGIPGVLIHGRYDVSSPLETAWRLSQNWSTSELKVLDDAGHGGGDSLLAAIDDALTGFGAGAPNPI